MLKILTSKQIKELDAYTIQHDPISSIDLMEKACRAFTSWFKDRFDSKNVIYIFCGTGNNGGDGLGIARMLHGLKYDVRVFVIQGSVPESPDFKINLDRLSKLILVNTINLPTGQVGNESELPDCTKADVIIDGIFGNGLSRQVEGLYRSVIEKLNKAFAIRIAIDIPSGLRSDEPSEGITFKAHHTVTFQLPKLAFFFPENYLSVGEWHVVKIGLSKNFIEEAGTSQFLLQRSDIVKILKPRNKFDHKGSYGKALLIAGSEGKMGAAILAARAALRSGVGLLTVHVPKSGVSIIQTSVPEAMVHIDSHNQWMSVNFEINDFNAVGIGPGLGTEKETVEAFGKILESTANPTVIDADGLNILSSNPELIYLLPVNSILTPHMKEFERLVGSWSNGFERLEKQLEFAKKTKTILIVKGAYSCITTPEGEVYFNPTGNSGMATGGSGDVLTGILTGLLAQGYNSLQSSLLGVYLHGLAGDIAAKKIGMHAMIASDIVESIGKAYQQISR